MSTGLWVKICGLRTADAVDGAVSAGAQATGFVFCESSPRNLDIATARELQQRIPPQIERVAVFLRPSRELVQQVLLAVQPDWIQVDWQDLQALDLPPRQGVLPVLRDTSRLPERLPPRVIFEGAVSGAGEQSDWQAAARLARRTEVVLAGGLNAGNVAEAVRAVGPFGIDVSSGVELSRGVKDVVKIRKFVLAARRASAA